MADDLIGEARLRQYIVWGRSRAADSDKLDWATILAPDIEVRSVSDSSPSSVSPYPTVAYDFTVRPVHLNGLGNLHGGCTATLFDFCTSGVLCLVSRPGFWNFLGVSRSLNVSYLKAIPVESRVRVECEIVSVGKRLAHLRGVIKSEDGAHVFATCEHTKVNTDPPPQNM